MALATMILWEKRRSNVKGSTIVSAGCVKCPRANNRSVGRTVPNKILIVDDEPFNLDLLEQELADQDYALEKASDGVEALEKVDAFEPDVILLDYMMPRMNGIEVVKRLKQHEKHKGIPVILLTAKGSQEDKARGLDAGADDYVVKPFEPLELLAR